MLTIGTSLVALAMAATAGINTNQIRTDVPISLNLSGVSAAEGNALSVSRSNHTHSISGTLPQANGGTGAGALTCSAGQHITSNGTVYFCSADSGGAGTGLSFLTATSEATLSNETNLGALTTGMLKHTVTAGTSVPATASAGTDYGPPTSGNTTGLVLSTTGTGAHTTYAGVTGVANQWISALSASGVGTLTQPAFSNISGTATSSQIPTAAATLGGVKMAAACGAGNHVSSIVAGELTCTADSGGGGAPTTATYITQTADAGLSAEQALSSLSTGIVKVTTGTGVLSTAASGTDYGPPTSGNATGLVLSTTTTGAHTAYGGTSCTNQFPRSLNASGAATCAGIGVADFTANQGTTTQVLHGNAAGQPSWGAIVAADLPTVGVAKGGSGLTTVAADQVYVGTAADTFTAKTLTNCTGASDAVSYNTTTHAWGCTTITAGAPSFSGLTAGGAMYADSTTTIASTAAGNASWDSLRSGGTGAAVWGKTAVPVLTTAAWTSSGTANALGIVGTGATPLTSPTYAAASPFGFRCQLLTTRPGSSNQPRYGIQSSGTVTAIDATAVIGLAGTAPARTTAMQDITTLATASCAAGCTANVVTGGAARTFLDTVEGAGVMNASGTLSLVMAPSASATHTIKIGSNCVWF